MAIIVTWADFDKSIFVTPKNIRKLMGFSIRFGGEQEKLENKVAEQGQEIENAAQEAHDAGLIAEAANRQASAANAKITYEVLPRMDGLEARIKALEDKS